MRPAKIHVASSVKSAVAAGASFLENAVPIFANWASIPARIAPSSGFAGGCGDLLRAARDKGNAEHYTGDGVPHGDVGSRRTSLSVEAPRIEPGSPFFMSYNAL